MAVSRRVVLQLPMSAALLAAPPSACGAPRFKAMAFDAFTVFDAGPIAALADTLFPGRGAELISLWRIRQFEYAWLRALAGNYADFRHVTEDALIVSARSLKLELRREHRDRLLTAYSELKTWPDAAPALRKLRAAGIRLALLSNLTPAMLQGSIKAADLDGLFEHVISTDQARTYKPSPHAYQLGVAALGLPKEHILFVAFAGWDAAGATTFGYPAFWVNRLGAPMDELGALADGEGATLNDLLAFAGA
jgi:2-haloacid dehalogenase